MSILKIENLTHNFTDGAEIREVLKEITYEFEKGKVYAILGYSGSGKTTLISLMSGLEKAIAGEVYFNNQSLEEIGFSKYRRNDIGIIFQQYNLIKYLSPVENLLVAMGITENQIPSDKKEVVYNLLDYVGIVKTKADRKINKLSGGEQQRVAIARALSTNVDLIFADEPTGNLDTETEEEVINLFCRLAKEHDKCIIIVTHANEVAKKADVILRLEKGKLKEDKTFKIGSVNE